MRYRVLRPAILSLASRRLLSRPIPRPRPSGFVSGVELCEQEVCGLAIFVAGFAGEIDDRPAVGLAIGGIIHDDLPTVVGAMADITDGRWSIGTLRRSEGEVTGGRLR